MGVPGLKAPEATDLVVGVGVEKCATTSFYDWLAAARIRSIPRRKETFYFSKNWHKGEEWFSSLYPAADSDMVFDITPSYFRDIEALRRIRDSNYRRKKILFFVRNQVARAYSFYCHDIIRHISRGQRITRNFNVARSFRFHDLQDSDYYFTRYSGYLQQLWDVFGRENVMTVIFERFTRDPGHYVDKMSEFVNADLSALASIDLPRSNESRIPYFLYSKSGAPILLGNRTVEVPPEAVSVFRRGRLSEVIRGEDRVRNALFCYGSWTLSVPKEQAEWLYRNCFDADTLRLEDMLQEDLGAWRVQKDYVARQETL